MRRKIICFQAVLSLVLIIFGTTSLAAKSTTITGKLETDRVEVKAELLSETEEILPGEKAKQVLDIKNMGADCYIRVSPVAENLQDITSLKFDADENWIFSGGSYYCKNILKKDGSVRFSNTVTIPEDTLLYELKLSYEVDAIQSVNFTPDFAAQNPWGSVPVFEGKNRGENLVVKNINPLGKKEETLEIHYNEDAKNIITNFDEIFKDIPLMHPGDSYKEVINLKNSGKEARTLYLSQNSDASEILKFIEVGIYSKIGENSKTVYEGNLKSVGKESVANVGTLMPGESGELTIEVSMDKTAGNEASNLSTHLSIDTWAEEVTLGSKDESGKSENENTEGKNEEISGNEDGGEKDNNDLKKDQDIKKPELTVRSAKTGDDTKVFLFMIAAGVLMLGGLLFVSKRD